MFQKPVKTKVHIFTKKEVLLQNIVEKDFQRYLTPLNFLQYMFLYPKYQIRDNFITPNGKLVKVLSFGVTCVYLLLIVIRVVQSAVARTSIVFKKRKFQVLFVGVRNFNFCLNAVGHVYNFVAFILHSPNNVLLILKLQEVMKSLQFDGNIFREIIFNWIYGSIVFVTFSLFYTIVDFFNQKPSFLNFVTDYTMMSFYVNMLYATRIMTLMKKNLLMWIEKLENTKEKNENEGKQYWKKMFEINSLIIDSYTIYVKVFQELILYYIIDAFLHSLTFLQTWLTYTASSAPSSIPNSTVYFKRNICLIVIWVASHFLYISILGIEIEQFYVIMGKSQTLASKLLATRGCTESERRMYKNVHRLYRSCFRKVNLNGMFEVDATLPLQLAKVTTANAIVILQFALI